MVTDWKRLWERVIADFSCDEESIHGPAHWRLVERNGLFLAEHTGADIEVVRLFAVLHDSCRKNDGEDTAHGKRASEYAATLRGELFELPDAAYGLLQEACHHHTGARLSPDPTIGTCWDADRLDLGRVGIEPSVDYMSTEIGCQIATKGWPPDMPHET